MQLNLFRLLSQITLLATAGILTNNMSTAATHHSKYILYVGTYGKGIYGYRYNAADSSLEPLSLVGEVASPSWVGTDPAQKYLFAVSELDGDNKGSVFSFAIDHASGKLTPINSRSVEGLAPCHLAVDKTGKVLVVANYTSGNVASYPIGSDGKIGEMASLMGATGSGPNKKRQEGPHAHETVFSDNNEFLYVPDLGLDLIHIFKFDTSTAQLTTAGSVKEAPGMGPRHIVFSPNDKFAYVINELKPAVSVYTHDAASGQLQNIQTISSVPSDQTGEVGPAEILIDKAGKHVYASNRGPGTIAVYTADQATGKLTLEQIAETGFTWPRGVDFDPSGNTLFVGDQKTDKFVTFHVDHATGKIKLTGNTYEVPSPVCFLFVPTS
jgi:6-phosphogluconolactonase